MFGLSDPHHVDGFGQCRPCDEVLAAVAVVLSLNNEHGLADVCEVANPVPVAALLLKRIIVNFSAQSLRAIPLLNGL